MKVAWNFATRGGTCAPRRSNVQRQFVFAPFQLDLVNEHLWREEELVPLQPKLSPVLRYLVERAGRLVTQEELRKAVWPTTVVSESVLRGAIREPRDVLGDDADAARFVETVPHRGYRFVATVRVTQPVHVATLSVGGPRRKESLVSRISS